jgi:hypothetical protein
MEHQGRNGYGFWYSLRCRGKSWLWILLLIVGALGLPAAPAAGQSPAPPEPVVLRADTQGLVLEWRAPALSLHRVVGDDGNAYSVLETPDWSQTDAPGQPRLPYASALAFVPPTGDVTAHVQTIEQSRRSLRYPVAPAPAPVAVGTPPIGVEWKWALDEGAYAEGEPRPVETVTVEEAGWQRGRRLVRLTFHPVDLAPGALVVTDRVRVELRFEGSDGVAQAESAHESGWAQDDPFIPVLQASVVNPAQVNRFARPRQTTSDLATLATSALDPPAGADYLIITHLSFVDAVAPLAAYRASSDGLRVFTITVETIYASSYGNGRTHPEAIKAYIQHAYEDWPGDTLSYVLLVGDGVEPSSSSYQSTDDQQTYVPPYLIPDPYGLLDAGAASDNRFVTVDGEDDYLADVFIGRFPVNTLAQATTVVNKILAYEQSPPQYPWNQRALFFADAPERPGEMFHQDSDEIYDNHLPSPFSGRRVYYCKSNCSAAHLYDSITTARNATMHELQFGGLIASYVGHSDWHQWVEERMFHLDDVSSLDNGGSLPVFLELTCFTSRFSEPDGDTLDESLLRWANGGAVATWGPTTQGGTDGHAVLHSEFFDAVFQDGMIELGPATQAAKAKLQTYNSDLHDTFILFGDPAMDLNLTIVPWSHATYLPVTLRAY